MSMGKRFLCRNRWEMIMKMNEIARLLSVDPLVVQAGLEGITPDEYVENFLDEVAYPSLNELGEFTESSLLSKETRQHCRDRVDIVIKRELDKDVFPHPDDLQWFAGLAQSQDLKDRCLELIDPSIGSILGNIDLGSMETKALKDLPKRLVQFSDQAKARGVVFRCLDMINLCIQVILGREDANLTLYDCEYFFGQAQSKEVRENCLERRDRIIIGIPFEFLATETDPQLLISWCGDVKSRRFRQKILQALINLEEGKE